MIDTTLLCLIRSETSCSTGRSPNRFETPSIETSTGVSGMIVRRGGMSGLAGRGASGSFSGIITRSSPRAFGAASPLPIRAAGVRNRFTVPQRTPLPGPRS
ncbi:hypothetical protein [Burkholderia gladioli]|uniref:hypothetical protein n=1 Tax=Burkholderia gladioli TaxID=28095 RepID=UPI00163E0EB6|nr:hypothetical protein [Burkholderia gladioli]